MDDTPEKVSSHMIFGAFVQKIIFRDGSNGHFGFGPMAENASIFRGTRRLKNVMAHRSQINHETLVAREWSRNCNSRPY